MESIQEERQQLLQYFIKVQIQEGPNNKMEHRSKETIKPVNHADCIHWTEMQTEKASFWMV
jgi:hypothetical protein